MTDYRFRRRCVIPGIVSAVALVAVLQPCASAAEPTLKSLCQRVFEAIDRPNIVFGLQGHELRTSSFAALDRIINFSRNCPDAVFLIVGHSDSIGDEAFNLLISRRRAASVADYLQRGGVDESRIRIEGRGSAEPVADNSTRSGRARNRRVELELLPRPAGE